MPWLPCVTLSSCARPPPNAWPARSTAVQLVGAAARRRRCTSSPCDWTRAQRQRRRLLPGLRADRSDSTLTSVGWGAAEQATPVRSDEKECLILMSDPSELSRATRRRFLRHAVVFGIGTTLVAACGPSGA